MANLERPCRARCCACGVVGEIRVRARLSLYPHKPAPFIPACGLFTAARAAKLLTLDLADMAIKCVSCGSFDVEGLDGCAAVVNRAIAAGLNPEWRRPP